MPGRSSSRCWSRRPLRRSRRRCCAGAATPRAARRSSKPIPADPQKLVGFDVEIAELIARELGRTPQFVQVAFASLDQSAARGDFDIGLSGIEDTPARRAAVAASIPVLPVPRSADRPRRPIATASARSPICAAAASPRSAARSPTTCCSQAEREHGIIAVSYDDDVHPYTDLLIGRVDAVLLDNVLADRAMRRNAGLLHAARRASRPVTTSSSPRPRTRRCAIRSNAILRAAMRDGTLEAIFRKWNVWNDDQPRSTPACSHRRRPPRRAHRRGRDAGHRVRRDAAVPAGAAARGGHHAGRCRAWRWRWRWRSAC